MKLREPRTKIPEETYWQGMAKLFHPLMFAPILMLCTIGTFLSNEVDHFVYLLELVGVSAVVIANYHLDEGLEKTTAPSVPKSHNIIIFLVGFVIGWSIAGYLMKTTYIIIIVPIMIAAVGGAGYNMDIPYMHNRVVYSLVWGGTPIFGSYMLQTGQWPNLTVIMFTIFGMLLAIKLFWNWSLRTCGRLAVCKKAHYERYCHGPDTTFCGDRLTMPKPVNNTMKTLQKLDLIILFCLMIGVVVM